MAGSISCTPRVQPGRRHLDGDVCERCGLRHTDQHRCFERQLRRGAISIDYDSNGAYDLLVPYSGSTWWVLYGSASGLSAPSNTGAPATTTGTGNNALATDVDGDGREDLVWADLVAGYGGGDAIRYRLRESGGAFSSTVYSLVGAKPADTIIVSGLTANRAGAGPHYRPQRRWARGSDLSPDPRAYRRHRQMDVFHSGRVLGRLGLRCQHTHRTRGARSSLSLNGDGPH